MTHLLQRRLLAELFFNFLLSAGVLCALILVGRMVQLRELLITLELTPWQLARLFGYLLPFFLLLILPIACMVSVFLTFLRLSTDRELLALKACGLSLYQLLPAPIIFSVLIMCVNFYVSFEGLAWGMNHFRTEVMERIREKTRLVLQPGVFNKDFPNLTIYSKRVDPNSGDLTGVFVRDRTRKNIDVTIVAGNGRLKTRPDKWEFYLILGDGRIYQREAEKLSVLKFKEYRIRLPLQFLVQGSQIDDVKPKEMSYADLLAVQADPNSANKYDETFMSKVRVELQKRVAMPLGCLVLGLFALPLACAFRGLKQHYGLILAITFFFIYYTLLSLSMSLGVGGAMPAWVGLWGANALFFGAAILGVRVTSRERNVRFVLWLKERLKGGGRAEA
ncbi:MAG: LPS export ABC transporter permease LptF [Desulfovibrionaceae bacterium]